MIDASERTVIRKLRLTAVDVEPTLFQLRLSNALSSVDLRPPSLPRSGIACIRRVPDPLPGKLADVRAGEALPRAWETAAVDAVDRLVRGAARPAQGEVSSTANAVVFADEAELLACLARDWCAGLTTTRWWWRSLVRFLSSDLPEAALVAWLESPRYVPAALRQLAASGQAAHFVQGLSVAEARGLLRDITVQFALDGLRAALDASSLQDLARAPEVQLTPAAHPGAGRAIVVGAPHRPGPWKQWVPESQVGGLTTVHQALLGVALMLHRAPAEVRSTAFAEAVRVWLRTPPQAQPPTTRAVASAFIPSRRGPVVVPIDEPRGEYPTPPTIDDSALTSKPFAASTPEVAPFSPETDSSAGAAVQPEPGSPRPRTASSPSSKRRVPSVGITSHVPPPAARSAGARQTPRLARLIAPRSLATPVQPALAPADTRTPDVADTQRPDHSEETQPPGEQLPRIAEDVELELDTRLGGLFFLINVALYLGLYGDFTSPAPADLPIPIWAFLKLLGRRLITGSRETRADPVWELLSRLAGRPNSPEGEGVLSAWRMPVDWLAPFPETGIWRWSSFGRRLRVRHPAGFLVLDVPWVGADRVSALLRETYAYRRVAAFELRAAALRGGIEQARGFLPERSPAERWMSWLAPYARARLSRALGDQVLQTVCAQAARVVLTETRLDVYFALDALPIEVRLAGLDRDPGWLPAAGRSVAFHFLSSNNAPERS